MVYGIMLLHLRACRQLFQQPKCACVRACVCVCVCFVCVHACMHVCVSGCEICECINVCACICVVCMCVQAYAPVNIEGVILNANSLRSPSDNMLCLLQFYQIFCCSI